MIAATLGLDLGPFLERLKEAREKLNQWAGVAAVFQGGSIFGAEVFEALNMVTEKLRGVVEMGAGLKDLSAQTGQPIRDLVILQQAFQNAGLGAEAVQPMIAKFQKSLSGINEEGLPTNAALERLHLNIEGFREMPAIEQFRQLQAAFTRIHDPVERTQLAMELFGKAGAKMLAMLSEGNGLDEAEEQVGGLADTMQRSAAVFHDVANAITTIGQKAREVFAGAFAEMLPGIRENLQSLTRIDFTEAGSRIGRLAVEIGALARTVWTLKPLLEAIAIQFAFGLSGAKAAAGLQTIRKLLTGLTMAIRSPREAFQGLQIAMNQSPGTGFFTTVGASLRGMLNSTLAVTAAIAAMMWAWNHYQQRREAVSNTALGSVDRELHGQRVGNLRDIAGIADEEGKEQVAKKLEGQLEELHAKLGAVDEEYASLGTSSEADGERAEITQRLQQEIQATELLIRKTRDFSAEQMKANAAHLASVAAIEAEKKKVEELETAYAKLQEEKKKAVIDALPPDQQEKVLLQSVGEGNVAGLDRAIETYESNMANRATLDPDGKNAAELNEQQRRLEIMLQVRRELITVEKRLTEERAKQSKQAADDQASAEADKKKREDFARKASIDIAKMLAQGRGDQPEVDRLDRQQRYDTEFEQATSAGAGTMEADTIARQKVAAQDSANAEKDSEKRKDKSDDSYNVVADSDRRVGLGGFGISKSADPLLKAHQDSVKAMGGLKGSIDSLNSQLKEKPERILMPTQAKFSR